MVPSDFSAHSRRALCLAMQGYPFGAAQERVAVEVLHVVDDSLYEGLLAADRMPDDAAIQSYLAAEIERAKRELSDLGIEPSLEPTLRIVHGSPYERIIERLEQEGVHGVLLGGQGHGGAAERLIGRTAQRVIRHAPCPVYVTRHHRSYAAPRKIVAAVDGSEQSRGVLVAARDLAQRADGTFSLLSVVEPPFLPYLGPHSDTESVEPMLEAASKRMAEQLEQLESSVFDSPRASRRHVAVGRTADAIVAFAEAEQAGTVVVGSHGRTGLSRFLLGSIAEALASSSRVDVFVHR